ncbi:MAG: type II toxin-antitoxin system VapC family toxin [Saprospiraceae bacterium]|nr:type II toxin-antitoxin system VapC family toxin [Saprospiraceae bacterium]
MNGSSILIDTNILIYASKDEYNLTEIFEQYDNYYLSIISYIEIYSYVFTNNSEKKILDNLMDELTIIDVNLSIAKSAIEYRKSEVRKVKLPDAIILSTAKYLKADLISNNLKDFLGIDDTIKLVGLKINANDATNE